MRPVYWIGSRMETRAERWVRTKHCVRKPARGGGSGTGVAAAQAVPDRMEDP